MDDPELSRNVRRFVPYFAVPIAFIEWGILAAFMAVCFDGWLRFWAIIEGSSVVTFRHSGVGVWTWVLLLLELLIFGGWMTFKIKKIIHASHKVIEAQERGENPFE